jgi:hypothetical protein
MPARLNRSDGHHSGGARGTQIEKYQCTKENKVIRFLTGGGGIVLRFRAIHENNDVTIFDKVK